jgi:hypothetical protein
MAINRNTYYSKRGIYFPEHSWGLSESGVTSGFDNVSATLSTISAATDLEFRLC